jgi:hypothetical protein
MTSTDSRPKADIARWLAGAFAIAPVAGAVVLFLYNPTEVRFYPFCVFHKLTGLHCPGCGALRAGHALLHGRIAAALSYNLFLVLSLPLIGYEWLSMASHAVRGRRLPPLPLRAGWIWALLVAIVVFTVLRNLPFEPFTWLAP